MKYNEEVLSKKIELTEEEYEKELIERISNLEHDYMRILKLSFKAQELFGKKILKKDVKNIKQKLRFLQKELDDNYKYEGSIYNNMSYSIIKLDYLFKTNTYDYFYKIKIEKNPRKKLKLYRKVYVSLIEKYNNLDKEDFKYRRVTRNMIDLIRLKMVKEKAKVKKLIQIESMEKKEDNIEYIEPLKEEKRDYIDITDSDIIKSSDIKEVILSYRNMIKKSPVTPELINYLSIIRSRLINEEVLDENFELINSVIDSIKYRKLYLKKRDKKEKNILRYCSNELKELSNQVIIRNIPIAEVHDYKFDMIFELLKDRNNYNLIKKIVQEYPVVVNVRNNKRSILSYILQLYLNNYLMILKKYKYEYNIDYLKEVYKLFASSSSLYLTNEEKMEIDSILDSFIYDLSELDINTKKKNYAIRDIKELYIDKISNENDYHKTINKDIFDHDIKEMNFLDPNHSKRSSEIDLTSEHTFMLENPYICYSFVEEKGYKSLKMHTVDFSNVVLEGSQLDKYVYNCMLDNKKVNKTISDYLEFKNDEVVSALTYEIVMDNDRKIKDFKIYRSRIKVDGDILDYSNNQYVYQTLRRIVNDYIQEFKDVKLTGLSKIEYILTDIMNKQYIKLIRNNNLPIIAKKERKIPAIDSDTFSRVKYLFNKLQKKDLRKLSKIFDSDIEEDYYDNKIRYDESNNLNIFGNPNYIYLLNQRMIKLLLLNERQISTDDFPIIKQRIIDEYDDTIKILNEILGYKKEEDFDYKKEETLNLIFLKMKIKYLLFFAVKFIKTPCKTKGCML